VANPPRFCDCITGLPAAIAPDKEDSVHSRTAIPLMFLVRLPSTTGTGRWLERGKIDRKG